QVLALQQNEDDEDRQDERRDQRLDQRRDQAEETLHHPGFGLADLHQEWRFFDFLFRRGDNASARGRQGFDQRRFRGLGWRPLALQLGLQALQHLGRALQRAIAFRGPAQRLDLVAQTALVAWQLPGQV